MQLIPPTRRMTTDQSRLQSSGISYSISSLVTGMQSSPVLVAHSQTKSVNITEGSLGYLHSCFDICKVSPIMSTFIQQVHRPHHALVHSVRVQIRYSGLYDALIFFCGDLVAQWAH